MKIKIVTLIISLLSYPIIANDNTPGKIKWFDIEEAITLSSENPKKIMVYVFSDNCGWCTRMERNTFANPVIIEYVNENYYPVKLDSKIRKDISIGSRTYKFIAANPSERTPAYHELVVTLLNGRLAYPALAFINEKMAYMGVEMGYKSPEDMEKWLHFIAEEAYLKYPGYDEFSAAFKGKLSGKED